MYVSSSTQSRNARERQARVDINTIRTPPVMGIAIAIDRIDNEPLRMDVTLHKHIEFRSCRRSERKIASPIPPTARTGGGVKA
jgi:hypothetical protein